MMGKKKGRRTPSAILDGFGDTLSSILPPKQKEFVTTSIRMLKWLLSEIQEIADESGYTRNEVMCRFIEAGIHRYRAEKEQNSTGSPKGEGKK